MNKKIRLCAASVLVLGLAGCGGAVVVQDSPGPRWSYFDGDFEYATRDGAIVTEVVGNPFQMPKDRFDAEVRRLMRNRTLGPPVEFVAGATPGKTDPLYKVVVAFNALPNMSGHELCKRGTGTPTRAGGVLDMAVAFCIGDSLKSEASGHTAPVAGPDAPRFAKLVRDVTLALIPVQDNEEQGEGEINP